jgi:hypothetical protein
VAWSVFRRGSAGDRFWAKCLETTSAADNWLTPAIPAQSGISPDASEILVWWGWFNPMGPTSCALRLVPVATEYSAILLELRHPFVPEQVVFGIGPRDYWEDPRQRAASLRSLFSTNGPPNRLLIPSIPSHVIASASPNAPVTFVEQRELFRIVTKRIDGDFERANELLQEFWCRPWDRAGAEFEDILAQYGQAARLMQVGDLGRARNLVNRIGEELSGGPSRSEDAFEEWWELVTDADHLQAELSQMPEAWNGAIAFQARAR